MEIRPFQPEDIDALTEIAKVSFAEEYTTRGETPESFVQQIRLVTRWRMIPFKLLTTVAGYKWEIFVAEVDGEVVGCGGFMGRKTMELANLMVHPHYRRRGIGRALLQRRLQRLEELGYPYATTTILATNEASLGNVRQQGFEVFDRYTYLEARLPLPNATTHKARELLSRPIQPADEPAFTALETRISTPVWLQIEGSASDSYFVSFGDRLMGSLTGTKRWARAFFRDDEPIGFLAAVTSGSQTKGGLARPVVADENLADLPAMLHKAADWLEQLGKTTAQVAVPDARQELMQLLLSAGWHATQTWVRLVKNL